VSVIEKRQRMLRNGEIKALPEASQSAADQSYVDSATKLCDGIENVLAGYADSDNPRQREIHALWKP
jgi:hypothetical protein